MSFLRKGAFAYKGSHLYAEELNLSSIGDEIETPCHVYSRKQLQDNIRAYSQAFGRLNHRIGFAIKANYNPELLRIINEEGLSAVAVSGNEVRLALEVGFKGRDIFLNGCGCPTF